MPETTIAQRLHLRHSAITSSAQISGVTGTEMMPVRVTYVEHVKAMR